MRRFQTASLESPDTETYTISVEMRIDGEDRPVAILEVNRILLWKRAHLHAPPGAQAPFNEPLALCMPCWLT